LVTLPTINYIDVSDFNDHTPGMIKFHGADVWTTNHLDLQLEDVQSAHSLGLEVYVWTVNTIADMTRMIEWGVDAIITDYPGLLHSLLNK